MQSRIEGKGQKVEEYEGQDTEITWEGETENNCVCTPKLGKARMRLRGIVCADK